MSIKKDNSVSKFKKIILTHDTWDNYRLHWFAAVKFPHQSELGRYIDLWIRGRGFWRDLPRDLLLGSRKLSSWHLLYSANVQKNYNERLYIYIIQTFYVPICFYICERISSYDHFWKILKIFWILIHAWITPHKQLLLTTFEYFNRIFHFQNLELVHRCQKKNVHFKIFWQVP